MAGENLGIPARARRSRAPCARTASTRGLACKSEPSGARGRGGLGSGSPRRPGRNERWPTGFMSDQLASGRRLRILNVVVDFSRLCVGQLAATSITGARLALFPAGPGKASAPPKAVICDNGPELTSKAMRLWSERSGAVLNFIQPGKPHRTLSRRASTASSGTATLKQLVQGPRRRQAHRGRLAPPLTARLLGLPDAHRAREASRAFLLS